MDGDRLLFAEPALFFRQFRKFQFVVRLKLVRVGLQHYAHFRTLFFREKPLLLGLILRNIYYLAGRNRFLYRPRNQFPFPLPLLWEYPFWLHRWFARQGLRERFSN